MHGHCAGLAHADQFEINPRFAVFFVDTCDRTRAREDIAGPDLVLKSSAVASHVWRPEHFKLAIEAADVSLWAWNVDDDRFTMDARGFEGSVWKSYVVRHPTVKGITYVVLYTNGLEPFLRRVPSIPA